MSALDTCTTRHDPRAIVEQVVEGSESLLAVVSSWPLTHLRNSHIVGAERSLIALQGLLVRLKALV